MPLFFERIAELGIARDGVVGESAQECDESIAVGVRKGQALRGAARASEPVVERGAIFHAADVVIHHLLQRGKAPIVHVGPRDSDILERG